MKLCTINSYNNSRKNTMTTIATYSKPFLKRFTFKATMNTIKELKQNPYKFLKDSNELCLFHSREIGSELGWSDIITLSKISHSLIKDPNQTITIIAYSRYYTSKIRNSYKRSRTFYL